MRHLLLIWLRSYNAPPSGDPYPDDSEHHQPRVMNFTDGFPLRLGASRCAAGRYFGCFLSLSADRSG
jgi:hypothetical protein